MISRLNPRLTCRKRATSAIRSCRAARPAASLNKGTTIDSVGADGEVRVRAPALVGFAAISGYAVAVLSSIYTAPDGFFRARPTGPCFVVLSGRGDDSGAPPKSLRSSRGG